MMNQKIGRNELCPCGSGKKFKRCCQMQGAQPSSTRTLVSSDTSNLLQIGLAQHQAGHFAEAEAIYSQVLLHQPQYPDALHYMGMLASQSGRSTLATRLIQQAIQLAPSALMHFNLATELSQQGKFNEAVGNFHQAITLKPDFSEAYCALGQTLKEQGLLAEAAKFLRHAITQKTDFFEANYALGQVLQDQGKHAEAEIHIAQAAQLRSDCPDVYVVMASIHNDLGRFEVAQAELSKALNVHPEHPAAWAMLSEMRKMTLSDESWLKTALKQVNTPDLLPDTKIRLLFAIGKYYDDTAQFDLAFSTYRQANELKITIGGGFDRIKFTHFINNLIHSYVRIENAQFQVATSCSERPVFIVGMPRSGTSLIEQIIASHPSAFGAGELTFWNEHGLAALHGSDPNQLAQLVHEYENLLQQCDASALRVVDKMPSNFMWLGVIKALFPCAKIIHAQRNPADTCLSIYFQDFKEKHTYASNLEDLAFYYREYSRLMAHWRTVMPPDNLLEVPYEALIDAPEEWIRFIIEFIGLDWNDKCLAFHQTNRKVATRSNWSVRQKIYPNSKARWRNYQSHIAPLLNLLNEEQRGSA